MTGDDRIRDAYRDLNERVARDIDPAMGRAADRPPPSSAIFGRPGLAIAGLVVVAAAGAVAIGLARGDDDQPVATDSTSSTTTFDVADAPPDDEPPDDGDGATSDAPTDRPGDRGGAGTDEGQRFRVVTELVSADRADPFLNVRGDPDHRSDLVAKLPAIYTGLVATGQTEAADDGGTWVEVELLHPVALTDGGFDGRRPTGWVNRAFVEPLADGLAVGTDEIPACDPDGDGFGDDGGLDAGHVYAIESAFLTGDCQRVVLTFGSGQAPFGWSDLPDGTGPAPAVPAARMRSSGGHGTTIDLGPTASAWSEATETGDGVYLVRADDGTIDLVVPAPSDVAGVTARPNIGVVVVDLLIKGQAPPAEAGVVLTRPTLAGSGTIEVVGLSRPFEAVLGASVEDEAGHRVEAVFSGNAKLGTRRTSDYGVATNDWTEAWGAFGLRVEGLAAGQYTLVLDAQDSGDAAPVLRLPFSLDDGGEPPTLASPAEEEAAMALIRFAQGGDWADVPAADDIALLLGPMVESTGPAERLADREAWTIGEGTPFAESLGPFNALPALGDDTLRLTAGPVPHCAGPPRDWPSELDGLGQVNIEPVGIDSCIAWFGVHLFLNDDDLIAAVAFDLFGP